MTNLTYFTCMVKIVAILIFSKVMQSMFLAFYFRAILELFHHVLQVKQILLFYGLCTCSRIFEDISQEI